MSGNTDKKGSVLIVGAGIGGMQAALDLAEGGFKVHLVSKDPSIGGTMSMLDKTFPTGDCAMCMISPKMVEVGRHPNINIMTLSEPIGIEGEPGNFKVRVKHKARSIDRTKCTGCGECTRACPVRNIIQIPERRELPPLEPDRERALAETLAANNYQASALIVILQGLNRQLKYLPAEVLAHVARRLDIPESRVLAVATFYNAFNLLPVGRHLIEVCADPSCHLKGSKRMIDRLREALQVEPGQTTRDERFTLRTASCIGCCSQAPAMRVDGNIYRQIKVSELPKILKSYE
jgi:NADH:ubiquinone oxidoreductase subunit E